MRHIIVQFLLKFIVVTLVTSFVIGSISYLLITKGLYSGENSVYGSFIRDPDNPEQWIHVTRWFIIGQVIRGLLMGLALLPFYYSMMQMKRSKRFLVLTSIYLVFGFWASSGPSPGSIEGLIYLKPDIGWWGHLLIQPQVLLEGACIGAWMALWMGKKSDALH
jgi:hypothetical protein